MRKQKQGFFEGLSIFIRNIIIALAVTCYATMTFASSSIDIRYTKKPNNFLSTVGAMVDSTFSVYREIRRLL